MTHLKKKDTGILGILQASSGNGDIPIDEITVDKNKITLKSNVAPFTIEGTINMENESIDCKFHQGDNLIPLFLKRVDALPDNDS